MTSKKLQKTEIEILDKGGEQLWTTSLNVAEKFSKSHNRLLKTIRELGCSDEFSLFNFEQSDYVDDRGKTQPMYYMTEDGFTLLVMGFTGQKAFAWKEKYIAAFRAMKNALKEKILTDARAARRQGRLEWQESRSESKTGTKIMAETVRQVREEQGKITKSHHYINENRLINWILAGEFTGLDRDSLTTHELVLIKKLTVKNSVLIARDVPYQIRKELLKQYCLDLRPSQLPPPAGQRLIAAQ